MSSSGDYYEYPNGILRNKYGIQDSIQLASVEAAATWLRITKIMRTSLPGNFDLEHLKAIHHEIFQDVYAWAGHLRTVDIGKGPGQFANHQYLISNANKIFTQLAQESHLQSMSPQQFSNRAAYYFGEINALHPFREGNGRTQRMFFYLLTQHVGFTLDWQRITEQQMIIASEASLLRGDNQALEQIFLIITAQ